MKVNKLTQLFEVEKTLNNYKNKIKKIESYLNFNIDGTGYNVLKKYKKDQDDIVQDFSIFDNRYFLETWAKALGLKFKDFKEDDFTEDGYLENGIYLRITYIITFFDNSRLHIDYDSDYYIEEVGIEEEGKMADDFKKDCNKEILKFDPIDLDNFKPIKQPELPKTVKPKIDID